MGPALANLLRNLRAGAALACFRPVNRLAFRIDLVQAILLFVVSAAIDMAGDYWRVAPPRAFVIEGFASELFSGALLVLGAAIVAISVRQRQMVLAAVVIVMASVPLVQVLHYASAILLRGYPGELTHAIEVAFLFWLLLILIRSVAVAFSPPPSYLWLRAILGGLLLSMPIWFADTLYESRPWWTMAGEGTSSAPTTGLTAGAEAVLAAQMYLIDDMLANLADEREGDTDLYFVGFAPHGADDAWRQSLEAAQQAMDSRWGTRERSILLMNNPRTLVTAPFATVTYLRETLDEIGSIIDPEDDVVMLYLAAPAVHDGLVAEQPPLSLVELSPHGLKALLDDAGIKWRIVVVSACDSGRFIEALADDYTLVITDTALGHSTFGCDGRTPPALFGDTFFTEGLGKLNSFDAAFDVAKKAVAAREATAGYAPPSDPQWSMGSAMATKIKSLRGKGTGGATARLRVTPLRPA